MKITAEITAPIFRCEADERIFLSRLYELEGFQSLATKDAELYLALKVISADDSLLELREICDMWHADYKVAVEDSGTR